MVLIRADSIIHSSLDDVYLCHGDLHVHNKGAR